MSFWESENLRLVMGGTWMALPAGQRITGLSTDSRALTPGQMFLAIKGDSHDGHRHVAEVAGRAPLAVIDDTAALPVPLPQGLGILKVSSTRRALLRLAAAYRRTLEGTRVIAVAGSNGKTTTVRLIESVLRQAASGTASLKSFNNDIGVPLTILGAKPGDGYLICEVGTNSPGEVARLAQVVEPDIAVITSIGREHLEKLGSLQGVAREEASVMEHVRRGGAGVFNADSPHLPEAIAALAVKPATRIGFGFGPGADVRVVEVAQDARGLAFKLNDGSTFRLGLLGKHNAGNAAAAVVVGRRMGLSDVKIAAGLLAARGPEMRLERSEIGGVCVLNDAYNANPDSMRAGLEALREVGVGAGRRVAILGDMLELGDHTRAEHRDIGRLLSERTDLDVIVLVGPSMKAAAEVLGARAAWVPDMDERHAPEVAGDLRAGDVVLLKGSRRMRLERLVVALKAHVEAGPRPQATCA